MAPFMDSGAHPAATTPPSSSSPDAMAPSPAPLTSIPSLPPPSSASPPSPSLATAAPAPSPIAAPVVLDALDAFSRQGIERVALIGWDFGGAVAIAAGAQRPLVTGIACLAPDTRASDAIAAISPRRLFLAHGSADTVIPQSASILLHTQAGHPTELALYPHETHDFIRYRAAILQRLTLWTSSLLRTPFKPGRPTGARPQPTLAAEPLTYAAPSQAPFEFGSLGR